MYLTFTKSKLLSLFSCSISHGFLSCMTLCTVQPACGLAYVSAWSCRLPWNDLFCYSCHLPCHQQAMPLWVPCSTIFPVLYHLFLIPIALSLCSTIVVLLISFNGVKLLCISYIVQHLLLHPLGLHSLGPKLMLVHCSHHLYLLTLLILLLSLLLWFHHLSHS